MQKEINSVIFTHLKPEIWHFKLARVLRRKGIKMTAFYLQKCDKEFYGKAFNEINCLDLPNLKPKNIFIEFFKNPGKFAKFFYKLFTIKTDITISEGPPYYLTAFYIKIFKSRSKRVFFPYDIYFARLKNPGLLTRKQLLGEKYCFRNCDAIMHKEGPGVLDLLPTDYNTKKPSLYMPIYCLKEWFAKCENGKKLSALDGEIHIVNPSAFYGGKSLIYDSMISYITNIIKQKIHLHFYVSGNIEEVKARGDKEVALNNKKLMKYFHIHKFVPPEKLSKEICKYDFGLYLIHYTKLVNPMFVKFTSGNKISSYLEAGIPFIAKEENKLNSELARKYGIGVVVKDIKNIREILKKFRNREAERKILKFRERYSFENYADKIIEFFSSLKKDR